MFCRRVLAWVGTAAVLPLSLALGSCLSPTLPVPPPEPVALQEPLAHLLPGAQRMQVDGTGAMKGALVFLLNNERASGTIFYADDNGAYHGEVEVDVSCTLPQNHIQLWQADIDGNASERRTYRLPNSFTDVMLPPGDAGCPDAGTADVNGADDGAVE
jgi:hypothetical protein